MARHPNHCYLLFECTYEIMFFFFLKFWNEEKCSLAKQAGLCPRFWVMDELHTEYIFLMCYSIVYFIYLLFFRNF